MCGTPTLSVFPYTYCVNVSTVTQNTGLVVLTDFLRLVNLHLCTFFMCRKKKETYTHNESERELNHGFTNFAQKAYSSKAACRMCVYVLELHCYFFYARGKGRVQLKRSDGEMLSYCVAWLKRCRNVDNRYIKKEREAFRWCSFSLYSLFLIRRLLIFFLKRRVGERSFQVLLATYQIIQFFISLVPHSGRKWTT